LLSAILRVERGCFIDHADYELCVDAIGMSMTGRGIRRRWSNNCAVATLEFALVAPVFVLGLAGGLYVSIQMLSVSALRYAAEEGARCAAVKTTVCTNATSTAAYARASYFGPDVPTFTYTAAACGASV